jgi:hypothetical protein
MPEAQNKHQWLSSIQISGLIYSILEDKKGGGSRILELQWNEKDGIKVV